MSSYVEKFLNSKESISDSKTLFEIKQHYNFKEKTLHVFVEADDDFEFYRKSIELLYAGFKIKYYPKNGKKFVLSSYNVLNWTKYNKSRILFFVDKDYEDFIGVSSKLDRNIFVTKFYAIENYISSIQVFEFLLHHLYKIPCQEIINGLLNKFELSFRTFEKKLIYLTSIILIYRRNSEHMDLDNLKMDDFFLLKDLEIHTLKYKKPELFESIKKSKIKPFEKSIIKEIKTIDSIKKTGADITKINYKVIRNNMKELKKTSDCKKYIRGKYQLWFFIKCISNINSMSAKINADLQSKNNLLSLEQKRNTINTSVTINESNIFDILPMKLSTHNDVNVFLIHNLQQI